MIIRILILMFMLGEGVIYCLSDYYDAGGHRERICLAILITIGNTCMGTGKVMCIK